MKFMGKIKKGGKALMYIAAGVIALGLVLASCGGDDGYGGGGGAVYLVSISVTPANATTATTQQFTATGTYSNYAMQNVTTLVTWSSSNDGVATISNTSGTKGLATCQAPGGPITITATYGAYGTISDTAMLTCT